MPLALLEQLIQRELIESPETILMDCVKASLQPLTVLSNTHAKIAYKYYALIGIVQPQEHNVSCPSLIFGHTNLMG